GYIIRQVIVRDRELMVFLGVSFGFLLLLYRQLVRIKVYSDKLCRVCCVLRGRKIYIKGFVDTGNVLQDPLFHRPVCIAQKDSFLEVLHEINDCTKVKYHVIPFRSLGCDSGMLEVITADTMYICYGKKEIQVEDALIGLTAQTLSSDGEYEFLVNAQLLKG
ncbi:MAG TPA: sigma-E processing peptidase SpoIIGA, partial [Lachnospira sp.]|nr:sigma-E processing peptidase SpoIIGA [Lachnospira sp.]